MTSKHRVPAPRSRDLRWLLALPVVGAIVVAGVEFGGGPESEGSLTLVGGSVASDVPEAALPFGGLGSRTAIVTAPTNRPGTANDWQRRHRLTDPRTQPWGTMSPLVRRLPTAAPTTPGTVGNLMATAGPPQSPVRTPAARALSAGSPRSSTSTPTVTPSVKVTPSAKAVASTTAGAPSASGSLTEQVITLTNQQRLNNGCKPLTVNGTLTSAAQAHSKDMAQRNFFDHVSPAGESPFDRITAAGYRYRMAAENIAAGYRTPADVVTGWMNSSGHRANILNCDLTEIGIGYATGGTYGVYWTQNFGTPMG